MDRIVLDTNVVAKLFLKEEWSDVAVTIKDNHIQNKVEVVTAPLLKYELISALKSKNFNKEEIKEALEVIRDYGFYVVELNDLVFNKIADFVEEYDISAYDAAYVALAHYMGVVFYTADNKLLLKVKKLGFVRHMKEFSV